MESKKQDKLPLQSKIFGHRFRGDQTVYEYLLEFLIVAFSNKEQLERIDENGNNKYKYSKDDLFPIGLNELAEISFNPTNNVALKRFIFFDKSKLENRYDIDKEAYEKHIEMLTKNISIPENSDYIINKKYAVSILQNILYGFTAVTENRSWFAQSLLPICHSALTSEIMGKKVKEYQIGNKMSDNIETFYKKVDDHFETNRYNFMARGGEIYYLHLLNAINNNTEFKEPIEKGFKSILNEFKEFEILCSRIQSIWSDEIRSESNSYKDKQVNKVLGSIPKGFEVRERYTLKELKNILETDMHPFEKIDILSVGIILQLIIATHKQSKIEVGEKASYMIFDIDCYQGKSNEEVKKIAAENFNSYTQDIINALHSGYFRLKDELNTDLPEERIIKNAMDESIKVYKKIGKNIGIIRPVNEKYARFTLDEKVLKFLVLALIKPGTKITFDTFLDKLYEHFSIVIGKEELLKYDNKINESMYSFLDINKNAMQIMLKECGFLRELSDSTSIVENPYMEV
ncbi:MAG: hypothetical protein ACRCTZ_02775 [Sarcina sp.]